MFRQTLLALTLTGVALAQAPAPVSKLIDAPQLLRDLEILAADDMQGRQVGTPGGEKARAYVIERFKASGLRPFGGDFAQPFTFTAGRGDAQTERAGANVVGWIEGTRTPSRYIVITAHYDHVGVRNGDVFNGADDNASGTAALFALAAHFSANRPGASLIFAAMDAEESGLRGARAFVANPPVDRASMVMNLNLDMIGRDPNDLLYVVGTHQQPFFKPHIERIAAKAPVKLVMGLIMVIVLFSRVFYVPGYLATLGRIAPLDPELAATLKRLGDMTLVLALAVGGFTILWALVRGMAEHRRQHEELAAVDGIED